MKTYSDRVLAIVLAVAAVIFVVFALIASAWANTPTRQVVVTRVTDGDTFVISDRIPAFPRLEFKIRVRGIDTPEKGRLAKCSMERHNAEAATYFTERVIREAGNRVLVANVGHDKFGGRIDADVFLPDGRNLASMLIEMGYARPYAGGKRRGWCE